MPKKNSSWGVNTKAVEARERKANQKKEEQNAKKKAIEDEYWKDDDKLDARKKDRKEKEQQKKQDALKRKQEAKKLLLEEEAKLSGTSKKSAPKKVTQADIDKVKEKERKQNEELAKQQENERKKIAENPEVEEVNPNRRMAELLAEEGAVEARSLTDAISVLNVGTDGASSSAVDIHPEKRMKAAFQEFEDRELPKLKAENPNLRLSQLKQMLRKEWLKSPDNPMNKR